jgi:hypothetical protein
MNEHGHLAYSRAPLSGAVALRHVVCPMCALPGGGAAACGGCGAPLTSPPRLEEPTEAFVGRRGSPRVERIESALWQPAGGGERMTVRLQDLSFTGLSLDALLPVPDGQVARVRAPNIDCVVQVVQCRREAGDWRVHARLLTMRLLTRSGAFVSTVA